MYFTWNYKHNKLWNFKSPVVLTSDLDGSREYPLMSSLGMRRRVERNKVRLLGTLKMEHTAKVLRHFFIFRDYSEF